MSLQNELDIKILESEPKQFTCGDCENFNWYVQKCDVCEKRIHPDSDICSEFEMEDEGIFCDVCGIHYSIDEPCGFH